MKADKKKLIVISKCGIVIFVLYDAKKDATRGHSKTM